jgi:hypothetical protein
MEFENDVSNDPQQKEEKAIPFLRTSKEYLLEQKSSSNQGIFQVIF